MTIKQIIKARCAKIIGIEDICRLKKNKVLLFHVTSLFDVASLPESNETLFRIYLPKYIFIVCLHSTSKVKRYVVDIKFDLQLSDGKIFVSTDQKWGDIVV